LRGVTSNPSIFEKAIGHGDDYDTQIAALEASGDLDPGALFERLEVTDIQNGADTLRPVYQQTQGRDGFISIEVSPYLAMDTGQTIEEVRRLWHEVGRENLMVKIPATRPGLPAIRAMIAEGININITLLFSQQVYAEVRGLSRRARVAGRQGRRPALGRQCGELLRQPDRHAR
jgi:transaldolase/glucose-6-phosphate isomerase